MLALAQLFIYLSLWKLIGSAGIQLKREFNMCSVSDPAVAYYSPADSLSSLLHLYWAVMLIHISLLLVVSASPLQTTKLFSPRVKRMVQNLVLVVHLFGLFLG